MTSATNAGGTVVYQYNGLNQRVYKSGPTALVPTGAAYYLYNEAGQLLGEYNASGAPVYETIYLGNMPVGVLKQTGAAVTSDIAVTVHNVYADHIATPRIITRQDQQIVWRWDTAEAFGATMPEQNPGSLGIFTYNQRFPGQVFDAETGLFQNWNREYNARLGRYMQSDPIGLAGGINTFAYVEGDPLSGVDPLGLWTFQLGFSVTGSAVPGLFGLGAYGQAGVGFAIDGNGNVAGYWTLGGGGALGIPGVVAGVQGAWSNGDTVCDLRGDATNVGLNAAGGWGGTVDTFGGRGTREQPVGGVGVTFGGGAGVSGYGGVSRTGVKLFGKSQACTCRAK